MPVPKPNPKLTDMVSQPDADVVTVRRRMFAVWMDECEAVHDALVEGLLANLPSLADG